MGNGMRQYRSATLLSYRVNEKQQFCTLTHTKIGWLIKDDVINNRWSSRRKIHTSIFKLLVSGWRFLLSAQSIVGTITRRSSQNFVSNSQRERTNTYWNSSWNKNLLFSYCFSFGAYGLSAWQEHSYKWEAFNFICAVGRTFAQNSFLLISKLCKCFSIVSCNW